MAHDGWSYGSLLQAKDAKQEKDGKGGKSLDAVIAVIGVSMVLRWFEVIDIS